MTGLIYRHIKTSFLLLSALLFATLSITQIVRAEDIDIQFYSKNHIIFYDPRCSGSATQITIASASKTLESFVDAYGQMAFDTGKKYGIPYEAILAQGALESGMGSSGLTQQANNFFGIKAGSGWTGPTITLPTAEQSPDGSTYTVNAAFRKYNTPQEGWDGYGQFITQNPRYKDALRFPGDPIAYIAAIKAAGYATDVDYVSKLTKLIMTITDYIQRTSKLPPSSQVALTNTPTGGSASTPTSNSTGCQSLTSGGTSGIAATARNLAWANKGQHNGTTKELAKYEYQIAMPQFNNYSNAGDTPWADCGVFVATVMKASGADKDYPGRGTDAQLNYLRSSQKYIPPFTVGDSSQLHPGDVLVLSGHTYIYTGSYTGDDGKPYSIAQASLGEHPPEAGTVFLSDSRGPYYVGRLK